MGDPYLESPLPPASRGATPGGPLDGSYTLTSLDDEAWISPTLCLFICVLNVWIDPFFIIVKEALCDTQKDRSFSLK